MPLCAAICIANHAEVAPRNRCNSKVRIHQLIAQVAFTPNASSNSYECGCVF